jgi:eukaryotic-like serine/threonine-protein kinase
MPAPPNRLGPYEIVAPLGAGGMGEVYKARDTRLARFVAIKILPNEVSGNPDRQRRFEQEARAVAALNHPNIVAVYDVGVQDGVAYLVQELVEGESLRGPIGRNELTTRETVELARQVASGLAAAHQAGIVHRDLKPENIMVTSQGVAKVLDFGLARQLGPMAASASEDTRTVALTQEGSLVGTLAYMSPEQARGQAADARSDIFSFGAVLYEMLSGKRAFHRGTAADTLSAVLKEDPAELPESTPAGLRQVTLHCLEKRPEQRFQSAQDLAFALSTAGGASVSAVVTPSVKAGSRRRTWRVVAVAGFGLVAAFLAGLRVAGSPAPDIAHHRHQLVVSELDGYPVPRWSPDGKSIAYGSFSGLYVQSLASPVANRLTRGVHNSVPFFSADGLRIWYASSLAGRSVLSIAPTGGEPTTVIENLGGFANMDGVALSPDGKSLVVAASTSGGTTLAVSSPPGAPPAPLAGAPQIKASRVTRARLRFSHDGSKLLVVFAADSQLASSVWSMDWPAGKGAARRLVLQLREGEMVTNGDWMTDNRHLVVSTAHGNFLTSWGPLFVADSESGAVWPLTANNASAGDPSVSADGRIVYARNRTPMDLMELPVDGSNPTELLATDWTEHFGAWSRTADEFVFVSDRDGSPELWMASADGSWQRKIAGAPEFGQDTLTLFSPEISPDGKLVTYSFARRIWISPVNGGRPVPLTPAGAFAITPTWSADGRWIAYHDAPGGAGTLWKVDAGGASPPVRIGEFTAPVAAAWSPDGKWITTAVDGNIGVVSPDGARKRVCFNRPFAPYESALGWSSDGATLYLIEKLEDHSRLSAYDVARDATRVIRDYPPDARRYSDFAGFSGRMSPSRDGKRLLATRWTARGSVWMLDGVTPPRPWWKIWQR